VIEPGVVTVTLNPALDQTLECAGFTAGAVNRVSEQVVHPGGKGINVAAFLAAHHGPPVFASGFLGTDNAAPFEALFAARGIVDRCVRMAGASRVNVKIVDRPAQRITDINLPGLEITGAAMDRLIAELEGLAAEGHCFVFAGSVPAGVAETIYADLMARVRGRGARVVVDASGPPLRHAVAARPDIVKPNHHELAELVGRPLADVADVLAAARELQRGGIGLVVVSMGEAGAVFVDGARALRAVPPPVEVVTTVGAGDALVAGVVAAQLAGADLEQSARMATSFAAGTVTRVGPSLPSLRALAQLAEATQVEELT
jgi:1-phosphofructokinase